MTTVTIKTKTQGIRTFCKDVVLGKKCLDFAEKRGKVYIPITSEQYAIVLQSKKSAKEGS